MRFFFMEPKGMIVVADAGSADRAAVRLDASEHVANRPIAHHVLDALESAGVDEVVVAVPAKLSDEVRDCLAAREQRDGLRLRYVEQRASLDLAGALGLAAPIVGSAPCIVHLANGLLGEPLQPLIARLRGNSPDVILITHQVPVSAEQSCAATQDVMGAAELDPGALALGAAGVCLFGPEALSYASRAAWRAGRGADLTLVAERINGAGGRLRVLHASGWRQYAGDPLDLLELNRIALDRLGTELHRPNNNGNRIEGRVLIHEHASVRSSVIVGPTVIGPGAHIADAYIGPYTSIGAGARIEGAEVERSIIAAGASIIHVGGRLVASVVGRDARIFRDFSLPRALRLRVGDGTVVALC